MHKMIEIKHVYEALFPIDGARILVDRLWPSVSLFHEAKFLST